MRWASGAYPSKHRRISKRDALEKLASPEAARERNPRTVSVPEVSAGDSNASGRIKAAPRRGRSWLWQVSKMKYGSLALSDRCGNNEPTPGTDTPLAISRTWT